MYIINITILPQFVKTIVLYYKLSEMLCKYSIVKEAMSN